MLLGDVCKGLCGLRKSGDCSGKGVRGAQNEIATMH